MMTFSVSAAGGEVLPGIGLYVGQDRSQNRAKRIMPIFMPFAGCPGKCVFCAQDRQTGQAGDFAWLGANSPKHVPEYLITAALCQAAKNISEQAGRGSLELAFFGGTFSGLSPQMRRLCLDFLQTEITAGRVACGRCSTRPDFLTQAILAEFCAAGLTLVELGVQSFNDAALALSGRGYTGQTALDGCRSVLASGLELGIQLLPGMPGCTPEVFLADVQQALDLRPSCLRYYPCLVPEGSALAAMWRRGEYAPWNLEETVTTLGRALRLAWQAQIPVLRLSVAPDVDFDATILAGSIIDSLILPSS